MVSNFKSFSNLRRVVENKKYYKHVLSRVSSSWQFLIANPCILLSKIINTLFLFLYPFIYTKQISLFGISFRSIKFCVVFSQLSYLSSTFEKTGLYFLLRPSVRPCIAITLLNLIKDTYFPSIFRLLCQIFWNDSQALDELIKF